MPALPAPLAALTRKDPARVRPHAFFRIRPNLAASVSREALTFVEEVGELAEAEAEGHHSEVCFGWGHAKVSLQTKKINGDFIMAVKIDRARSSPDHRLTPDRFIASRRSTLVEQRM